MVVNEPPATYRMVYVGTGRQSRSRSLPFLGLLYEPERDWRERLAKEQEEACQEMASQGLRLVNVVPVISSAGLQGGWTEGAWLYFSSVE